MVCGNPCLHKMIKNVQPKTSRVTWKQEPHVLIDEHAHVYTCTWTQRLMLVSSSIILHHIFLSQDLSQNQHLANPARWDGQQAQ